MSKAISVVALVERISTQAPDLADTVLADLRTQQISRCPYEDGAGNSASSPDAGYETQNIEVV